MMVLPGHRAETAHLPEQPLRHRLAPAQVGGKEAARLLCEIEQDGAGLEHGDGLATVRGIAVDDGGHPVVRREGQELRLELVAGADVDGMDCVIQSCLFEEHRYLVAVRRWPVVEIDHLGCFPCVVASGLWCLCQIAEWSFTASSRAGFSPRNRSSTAAGSSRLRAIILARVSPPRITSKAFASIPSTMASATAEAGPREKPSSGPARPAFIIRVVGAA